jgi:hypothetical protein
MAPETAGFNLHLAFILALLHFNKVFWRKCLSSGDMNFLLGIIH